MSSIHLATSAGSGIDPLAYGATPATIGVGSGAQGVYVIEVLKQMAIGGADATGVIGAAVVVIGYSFAGILSSSSDGTVTFSVSGTSIGVSGGQGYRMRQMLSTGITHKRW